MTSGIFALLGLAILVAGWVLRLILPGIGAYSWAILALGAGLIGLAVAIDAKRISGALTSRSGRFGIGTTAGISLFAGILILANAISVGSYHRFDFTGLDQFTLTSQTRNVLDALDKQVEAVIFFTPGATSPVASYAESLLGEYQIHTDRLTVRRVDPDLRPDQARQYGVDQVGALVGAVVFSGGAGRRQVLGPQIRDEAEHAFTSAILEVTGTRQKVVYFLTGHGESTITANYAKAGRGLRDNLYKVAEHNFAIVGGFPEDAAVVVIAGPQRPIPTTEITAIGNFLDSGGRLFVLLNPEPQQELRRLFAHWGIDIEAGYLIDPPSHVVPNPDTPLVDRDRNTFGISETYFPGATAVIPRADMPEGLELGPLIWTTPQSWLERTVASGEAPVFETGTDRKGPLAIGALVSTGALDAASAKGARLAVIGDSDFATDRHFHNGNNADLFVTVVNWLSAGEAIVSVDRKVLAARRLILSPAEARFLNLTSVALFPFVLFVAGGFVWWRRQ